MDNGKRKVTAFIYCLKVLIYSVVTTTTLLTITVHIMTKLNTVWSVYLNSAIIFIFALNTGLFCPLVLVRDLIKPLEKLNEASDKLARNRFDAELDYTGEIKEVDAVFKNMRIMSEELSSIETMRFDFVSNVSHEFKTPLAAIEGCVAVLQSDELTKEERDEYFRRILSSTANLSSLVSNILMLNKLDNLTTQPEISTFRLDDQILQILLQQEPAWSAKDIYFDLHMEEITYTGAQHLLYNVWSNLISNAIKYSHEHGKILIYLQKTDDGPVFTITDSGIGMTEKELRHIFDKFYQADHKREGNGLGLAQVNKILELTGNRISVKSNKNEGSSFIVHLAGYP